MIKFQRNRLLPALLKFISVSLWREFECPKNFQKYMKFLKKHYIKNDSQLNGNTWHCYFLVLLWAKTKVNF